MIETVNQTNFADKVLHADKPVLLACLQRDRDFPVYVDMLNGVAAQFQDEVRFYLLEKDCPIVCSMFNILGWPTFIIFKEGRDAGRLLGRVVPEELTELCSGMLTQDKENSGRSHHETEIIFYGKTGFSDEHYRHNDGPGQDC